MLRRRPASICTFALRGALPDGRRRDHNLCALIHGGGLERARKELAVARGGTLEAGCLARAFILRELVAAVSFLFETEIAMKSRHSAAVVVACLMVLGRLPAAWAASEAAGAEASAADAAAAAAAARLGV